MFEQFTSLVRRAWSGTTPVKLGLTFLLGFLAVRFMPPIQSFLKRRRDDDEENHGHSANGRLQNDSVSGRIPGRNNNNDSDSKRQKTTCDSARDTAPTTSVGNEDDVPSTARLSTARLSTDPEPDGDDAAGSMEGDHTGPVTGAASAVATNADSRSNLDSRLADDGQPPTSSSCAESEGDISATRNGVAYNADARLSAAMRNLVSADSGLYDEPIPGLSKPEMALASAPLFDPVMSGDEPVELVKQEDDSPSNFELFLKQKNNLESDMEFRKKNDVEFRNLFGTFLFDLPLEILRKVFGYLEVRDFCVFAAMIEWRVLIFPETIDDENIRLELPRVLDDIDELGTSKASADDLGTSKITASGENSSNDEDPESEVITRATTNVDSNIVRNSNNTIATNNTSTAMTLQPRAHNSDEQRELARQLWSTLLERDFGSDWRVRLERRFERKAMEFPCLAIPMPQILKLKGTGALNPSGLHFCMSDYFESESEESESDSSDENDNLGGRENFRGFLVLLNAMRAQQARMRAEQEQEQGMRAGEGGEDAHGAPPIVATPFDNMLARIEGVVAHLAQEDTRNNSTSATNPTSAAEVGNAIMNSGTSQTGDNSDSQINSSDQAENRTDTNQEIANDAETQGNVDQARPSRENRIQDTNQGAGSHVQDHAATGGLLNPISASAPSVLPNSTFTDDNRSTSNVASSAGGATGAAPLPPQAPTHGAARNHSASSVQFNGATSLNEVSSHNEASSLNEATSNQQIQSTSSQRRPSISSAQQYSTSSDLASSMPLSDLAANLKENERRGSEPSIPGATNPDKSNRTRMDGRNSEVGDTLVEHLKRMKQKTAAEITALSSRRSSVIAEPPEFYYALSEESLQDPCFLRRLYFHNYLLSVAPRAFNRNRIERGLSIKQLSLRPPTNVNVGEGRPQASAEFYQNRHSESRFASREGHCSVVVFGRLVVWGGFTRDLKVRYTQVLDRPNLRLQIQKEYCISPSKIEMEKEQVAGQHLVPQETVVQNALTSGASTISGHRHGLLAAVRGTETDGMRQKPFGVDQRAYLSKTDTYPTHLRWKSAVPMPPRAMQAPSKSNENLSHAETRIDGMTNSNLNAIPGPANEQRPASSPVSSVTAPSAVPSATASATVNTSGARRTSVDVAQPSMLYGHNMVLIEEKETSAKCIVYGGFKRGGYSGETDELWLLHLDLCEMEVSKMTKAEKGTKSMVATKSKEYAEHAYFNPDINRPQTRTVMRYRWEKLSPTTKRGVVFTGEEHYSTVPGGGAVGAAGAGVTPGVGGDIPGNNLATGVGDASLSVDAGASSSPSSSRHVGTARRSRSSRATTVTFPGRAYATCTYIDGDEARAIQSALTKYDSVVDVQTPSVCFSSALYTPGVTPASGVTAANRGIFAEDFTPRSRRNSVQDGDYGWITGSSSTAAGDQNPRYLAVFGGIHGRGESDDFAFLDLKSYQWTVVEFDFTPPPRFGHTCVLGNVGGDSSRENCDREELNESGSIAFETVGTNNTSCTVHQRGAFDTNAYDTSRTVGSRLRNLLLFGGGTGNDLLRSGADPYGADVSPWILDLAILKWQVRPPPTDFRSRPNSRTRLLQGNGSPDIFPRRISLDALVSRSRSEDDLNLENDSDDMGIQFLNGRRVVEGTPDTFSMRRTGYLGRCHQSCFIGSDSILFQGGSRNCLNECFIYNLRLNQWTKLSTDEVPEDEDATTPDVIPCLMSATLSALPDQSGRAILLGGYERYRGATNTARLIQLSPW